MSVKTLLLLLITIFVIGLIFDGSESASVIRDGKKIYIEDYTGERWDVTQAQTHGFKAEWFQYGIDRNAFTPLEDSLLVKETSSLSHNPRIIGVTDGIESRAYYVPKLRYHEIANSHIGEKPICGILTSREFNGCVQPGNRRPDTNPSTIRLDVSEYVCFVR